MKSVVTIVSPGRDVIYGTETTLRKRLNTGAQAPFCVGFSQILKRTATISRFSAAKTPKQTSRFRTDSNCNCWIRSKSIYLSSWMNESLISPGRDAKKRRKELTTLRATKLPLGICIGRLGSFLPNVTRHEEPMPDRRRDTHWFDCLPENVYCGFLFLDLPKGALASLFLHLGLDWLDCLTLGLTVFLDLKLERATSVRSTAGVFWQKRRVGNESKKVLCQMQCPTTRARVLGLQDCCCIKYIVSPSLCTHFINKRGEETDPKVNDQIDYIL